VFEPMLSLACHDRFPESAIDLPGTGRAAESCYFRRFVSRAGLAKGA